MEDYRTLVIVIKNFLRDFAEDRTIPLDIRRHEILWNFIQSIDKDLEELDKKNGTKET
jgi:antitoxin component of RelBE/YafQ-DinJ toxin-antitoxin module